MIYLVEDDNGIRELVLYTLASSGFDARGFENASSFWQVLKQQTPRLILLDIMLPDQDGISILKDIRASAKTAKIPVIMLTAKGTEYDKVIGLDSGADDYLPKPFGMMELVARIKSVLRRCDMQNPKKESYVINGLEIDVLGRSVNIDGKKVELTFKEFELLHYMLQNMGQVLDRQQILNSIWGYDFDGETRTVDVHIRTLRSKLGKHGDIIETVRGVGYKIQNQSV